jgi:hypothetical protein
MTTDYWISSSEMTGLVRVKGNEIILAPPIWSKFIGQHPKNLSRWLRKKFGKIKIVRLENDG